MAQTVRLTVAVGGLCCASAASAESAVAAVGGQLFTVAASLCVVVAAIFAAAWLARRFGVAGRITGGRLRTLAATNVGGRERVVLLEVNGVQVLIGVAPGNVRTLHTFNADEIQTFAATLREQGGAAS